MPRFVSIHSRRMTNCCLIKLRKPVQRSGRNFPPVQSTSTLTDYWPVPLRYVDGFPVLARPGQHGGLFSCFNIGWTSVWQCVGISTMLSLPAYRQWRRDLALRETRKSLTASRSPLTRYLKALENTPPFGPTVRETPLRASALTSIC